ncbi:MAG TPA: hypothetical protein P5570_02410 [Candidatus Paceibacterota bacterium]|jgi:hypothetical protein|nr:hypothetical protein [Candidatus Paceibacterota bacterium]
MKDFFKKLQNADISVRKRYLIIFSVLAMVVVISLWIFYLKTVVNRPPESQGALKNFFLNLGQWFESTFFKIKEGNVINIERQ